MSRLDDALKRIGLPVSEVTVNSSQIHAGVALVEAMYCEIIISVSGLVT